MVPCYPKAILLNYITLGQITEKEEVKLQGATAEANQRTRNGTREVKEKEDNEKDKRFEVLLRFALNEKEKKKPKRMEE